MLRDMRCALHVVSDVDNYFSCFDSPYFIIQLYFTK